VLGHSKNGICGWIQVAVDILDVKNKNDKRRQSMMTCKKVCVFGVVVAAGVCVASS
jgi:hypothetical protein